MLAPGRLFKQGFCIDSLLFDLQLLYVFLIPCDLRTGLPLTCACLLDTLTLACLGLCFCLLILSDVILIPTRLVTRLSCCFLSMPDLPDVYQSDLSDPAP